MGKQAIDDDSNQTGRCWPPSWLVQATFAEAQSQRHNRGSRARSTGGWKPFPSAAAVVTTDLRLNEPRRIAEHHEGEKKPLETRPRKRWVSV
jgi:hypothetical protein